ncbi:receptor activity-modifying protein 3-like [Neolamprologus brichardi]|uniref:Receptor activity-modifying protein 3-like n=1 Tax=Neolamprologus brichardi TaxID=32507 RepID=A0A3Q4I495_NEOBR|nr:receptor activity-modifying protein 3-like [Neolamprologus brichardi]
MILYLLLSAFVLGTVTSQSANSTAEKLDEVGRNQTFNSTLKPKNVTSTFYEEKKAVEDKLQSNQGSVITEDEESFQDEENKITGENCNRTLLQLFSSSYCGEIFHQNMWDIGRDNWCVQERFISAYSDLTHCVEYLAKMVGCFFPNPDIQDFFIDIHLKFFQNCTNENDPMTEDAPQKVVIGLTLLSVSFIPIMVYLVARS